MKVREHGGPGKTREGVVEAARKGAAVGYACVRVHVHVRVRGVRVRVHGYVCVCACACVRARAGRQTHLSGASLCSARTFDTCPRHTPRASASASGSWTASGSIGVVRIKDII
eukprot:3073845-Rhodomonas_salina.1